MKFSIDELSIIQSAVSFLLANRVKAENELDVDLDESEISKLELRLYEELTSKKRA